MKSLAVLLVLAFGAVSLVNLDRCPPVYVDEVWILSIGHKLFSEGVFGCDLFSGFHGMERHFFHFMPLMSIVQGATTRLLGIGVLQMRLAPAALGMLTLWLTFVTVASELSSTVVLYSGPWTTMTVAMFQALEGTSAGVAAAAATVLIICTILPVALVYRLLRRHELSMR